MYNYSKFFNSHAEHFIEAICVVIALPGMDAYNLLYICMC